MSLSPNQNPHFHHFLTTSCFFTWEEPWPMQNGKTPIRLLPQKDIHTNTHSLVVVSKINWLFFKHSTDLPDFALLVSPRDLVHQNPTTLQARLSSNALHISLLYARTRKPATLATHRTGVFPTHQPSRGHKTLSRCWRTLGIASNRRLMAAKLRRSTTSIWIDGFSVVYLCRWLDIRSAGQHVGRWGVRTSKIYRSNCTHRRTNTTLDARAFTCWQVVVGLGFASTPVWFFPEWCMKS